MDKEKLIRYTEQFLENAEKINDESEKRFQRIKDLAKEDPSIAELFGDFKVDDDLALKINKEYERLQDSLKKLKND